MTDDVIKKFREDWKTIGPGVAQLNQDELLEFIVSLIERVQNLKPYPIADDEIKGDK